jgi:bifunctional non-homologous end joining protein LigD
MLPEVMPMLAVPAQPFDCAGHCFEVKWDGVRALAAVEEKGWRIWGRDRSDYTTRYPELSVLRALPPGTLVDGELVTLRGGLPHLAGLLQRHFLSDPWKIRRAASWCPVHYVLFDLLYLAGRCLLREPLARRREALEALCRDAALPGVIFSAGVVGAGRAFYEAVVAQGHEGVVAKLLAAPYRPGRRWAAWKKIKPRGGRSR